jgi:uncharacterized protein YndB with AHSA1/START domain
METKEMKAVITRTINAPRELVFKAWIDPKHLAKWWGPRGFSAPVCEVDPKVGGKIRIHMDHPQFPHHWLKGEFKEIKEPEKLVYTSGAYVGEDSFHALEGINTITFETIPGGKTKLTVVAILTKLEPGFEAALAGMEIGWSQSIDKLEEIIATVK